MTRFKHSFMGLRPWTQHSKVLMGGGLSYVFVGFSYIFIEQTPNRMAALKVALSWAPLPFWGCVFVFAGLLAVISSRWPPITETWGYTVLTGLSAGWSATYLMGVILEHAPLANLSAVAMWGLLAFMWYSVSGLVNPDKAVVVVKRDGCD